MSAIGNWHYHHAKVIKPSSTVTIHFQVAIVKLAIGLYMCFISNNYKSVHGIVALRDLAFSTLNSRYNSHFNDVHSAHVHIICNNKWFDNKLPRSLLRCLERFYNSYSKDPADCSLECKDIFTNYSQGIEI